MENQSENQFKVPKKTFLQSTTAKMIMVGVLTLVLLIPLNLVQNLIQERSIRKDDVIKKETQTWGENIHFMGPILKVPVKTYTETEVYDEQTKTKSIQKQEELTYAYFFPETLQHTTEIEKVDQLKRGIYKPIVFKANLLAKGNFSSLDLQKLDCKPEDILWDKTSVIVKTTDLKSIKSDLKITLNNSQLTLEANADSDAYFDVLETETFSYQPDVTNPFQLNIQYNGSNSIEFIPIGKTTATSIDANWSSPSFTGTFASNDSTKKITAENFHADWKIIHVNRPFSQQYLGAIPNLNNYSYGVKLIEPVDEYQQNERSSKYGFLVIGLTFLVFFLIQTISKVNIHIFQYTMIGLALIMFYTLLISITEHSSFTLAYAIAAASVIIMLLLYSVSVLKSTKYAIFISLSLTALYSFIYVIIQLEDYALLVGSIGLFLILGAVMYFSRKIDWNN
ncbi:cell envelope integrity protein CreD [Flavobacterium sp. NRK F10]|uniref:cell envelope integrity protein CreD n=1 Tax=Flavobacterium sp. NRK F10 TaxID=2954931 RepID=UPI002091426D|nr:cell envelope integrity protein CreD [Flavobacterium sp. NRK F10]MCO6176465.1 cell envelope integrity protein CreD [Flavobacterium sp. NRK F10]